MRNPLKMLTSIFCWYAGLVVAMGKKNRKAKSVAADSESGMPRHVRREVLEIVNLLLDSECADYFDVSK